MESPEQSNDLVAQVASAFPPASWQDVTVVAAVSGGADSTAMLRTLHELGRDGGLGTLVVAHFNHHWRGSESDKDAEFVQSLATSLGLECHLGHTPNPHESDNNDQSEQRARENRYSFLTKTAKLTGARYLATAHTRDDQVETILHRIIRGTGLRGLKGIPRIRVIDESLTIVRPLLQATRRDIEDYLVRKAQPFRTDDSNADTRYFRNRLRHELLPLIRSSYHADVDRSLLRLAQISTDAHEDTQRRLSTILENSVEFQSDQALIHCDSLNQHSIHLLRELALEIWQRMDWPLHDLGFEKLEELAGYLRNQPSDFVTMLPGKVRVEVRRQTVRLIRES